MTAPACRGAPAERGSVAILTAIVITVLFVMSSMVVDLAAQRADVRISQEAVDFAATAGASAMDRAQRGTRHAACMAAWTYFFQNALPGRAVPPDPCGAFPQTATCDASTPPTTVTGSAGIYQVSITNPVEDADPAMGGRLDPDIDGDRCHRIRVGAVRTRGFVFGPLIGARESSSFAEAIARANAAMDPRRAVPVVITEPTRCNSIEVSGQAELRILGTGGVPGIIAVDSSGTGTGPPSGTDCAHSTAYVVDPVGSLSRITVDPVIDALGNTIPGIVQQFALEPGQGNARAFDPADVQAGRLSPQPTPGPRITRMPVDEVYHCGASTSCPGAGSIPDHIGDLEAFVGPSGQPPGFTRWTGGCRLATGTTFPAGDWYIPCARLNIDGAVVFHGGNIVLDGELDLGSQAHMIVNPGSVSDSWLYVRNGNITKNAQAVMTANRTMVYMANGRLNFGGGSGAVTWTAPEEGPFEDLAFWNESTLVMELGGQANMRLEGLYFAPNTDQFRFTGQGGQVQVAAQFFVRRLGMSGQGALVLAPIPGRMILVPVSGVRLIR